MKTGLRQSMAWLHTWGGLTFGWALFMIFLAGALSVFAEEITEWMSVPSSALWQSLFPVDAPEYPRSTEGGRHFIRMHYALHADLIGIWIVGAVTIGMLAALVSGVIIHVRIFRDFFTFRPGKGQRAWLDAHNAFSVMTLPFMLMIGYTGLVIFYMMYMPFSIAARYGDDDRAFRRELRQRPELAGEAQAGPPPAVTAPAAEKHPPLYRLPQRYRPSVPNAAQGTMLTLHIAHFGGAPMRWLYFLCGLAGTAAIGAGLVLFAVKRKRSVLAGAQAPPNRFYQFAERLNVGVIAGLCIASVGFFWINRLVPSDVPNRANFEIQLFHALWAVSVAHALWRTPARGWTEQWIAAALLCAGLPLLNMLSADVSLLTTLPNGEWGLAGVDLASLASAALFAAMARAAYKKRSAALAAPALDEAETNAA